MTKAKYAFCFFIILYKFVNFLFVYYKCQWQMKQNVHLLEIYHTPCQIEFETPSKMPQTLDDGRILK